MMLTVSMTVSHLYQNLENIKSVRSLKCHPLQHKLAVIRTLLERSDSIVTDEEDRKQEEEHIRTALHTVVTRIGR